MGSDATIHDPRCSPRATMDLLQRLRCERAEKRTKQRLVPTLFDRICGLVKEFSLGETFLQGLERVPAEVREEDLTFDRVKPKRAYDPPMFSLATEAQYRVTMAILARVANPYLNFVSSPDEILLCDLLYRQNPALPPERLAQMHFEALLLAGVAERRMHRLGETEGRTR